MAIETFSWPTERGEAAQVEYRVRESRFGDGYRQVVADGPNNKQDSYPITAAGTRAEVRKMMEFFDRHGGAKAFLWYTPMGDLGLFTCKDPRPTPVGGGRFKIAATFERAFHP
ncbi:phage tail protein [Pseudomonas sp. REB1044]|uniref:phage tail protein n=1 Tax=Pseudomonas sp. REB1044 TaxID=2675224 RepID=UPI00315DFEF1